MASDSTTAGNNNVFETPVLDAEAPNILQQISQEGGYAYVRMSTLAAAGDLRAAEAAREMAWEQLHSGPWHAVLPVWRDAYAMACLHVAKYYYGSGEYREAIKALDLGLIMGGEALRKDLDSAVVKASSKERAHRVLENGGAEGSHGDKCVFVNPKLNMAEVLQSLPKKSLSCKIIGKRSALSLEGFLRDYFLSGSPVILSDSMAHWPARTKWNDLDYLKKVAGYRTVPVEVGRNYLCSDWKQELITFSEFLERIQSNSNSAGPTYLAQHPLFEQIQELRRDIIIPDYCFAGGTELRSLNAWFGPAATVTPLHHDPHHNILAQVDYDTKCEKRTTVENTMSNQGRCRPCANFLDIFGEVCLSPEIARVRANISVVGKKYIRLYPASLSEELYPHTESMLCNSSQVDLDNIDEKEFPNMCDLEFLDCVLEEGEMLYIPPRWWHYVRSLTTSFSVSFWWSDSRSSPVT